MSRYVIRINYVAHVDIPVEGDFENEGEALEKARTIAEECDKSDFIFGEELDSKILSS